MTRAADRPHHDYLDFGPIEPAEARARAQAKLVRSGVWIPDADMDIAHMLLLIETVHHVNGRAIYTPHEIHPLGPMAPTTELGLLTGALMRRNRDMVGLHDFGGVHLPG